MEMSHVGFETTEVDMATSPIEAFANTWARMVNVQIAMATIATNSAMGIAMAATGTAPLYDPQGKRSTPVGYWTEFFGLDKT